MLKKEAVQTTDAERKGGGMPFFVLACGLLLSAIATVFVAKNESAQRRAEFNSSVRDVEENIRSRMDSYVSLLVGSAGLMAAIDRIDTTAFSAYVSRLGLSEHFPGVQGIGYTVRISGDELSKLEETMRRQGRSEFKVWPNTQRDEYFSIVFLEPMDRRNAAALGYDMFTDPIRRKAMEKARDTGQPAATARVTLVQEIIGPMQHGFLIYVPVYAGGGVPDTIDERREKLRGFVYSPFRVGDLMDGIVGKGVGTPVKLRLYDEGGGEENLLHTMMASGRINEPGLLQRSFPASNQMEIAGRTWILEWQSAPHFLGGAFGVGAILIGLSGLLLSLFLFSLVRDEQQARAASEANARALLEEQQMLRLSEERFRLFLERAQEYAIMLVDTSGRISSWNPGAERLFGYTDSEILGKPVAVLYSPEDQAAKIPEKEIQHARELGQELDERWHVRKDGSRFFASGSLISLRNETSLHHGYAKILRDMTVRKENEEAIRHLNQQLEDRVRARTAAVNELNAQLEAFTYTVVHDLRAPLRAMHGFSTALIDDYGKKLEPNALDSLRRIIGAAERMDGLIHDLLDLSKVSRADLSIRRVNLSSVVRSALTTVQPALKESQAHIEVAEPLPDVMSEFKILERVVANLLSNAMKFARPTVKPEIRIFAESRGSKIRVFIRDNGIGIHPEHQQRIFRVFERLHGYDSYPGTGMGLAIVKKSIERLGGSVGVESAAGIGSTFWFEVPAPEPKP